MITYQILEEEDIIIVEPMASLSEEDFRQLTVDLDRHLARRETLRGILVHAKEFPGWKNLEAAKMHLNFVRDHHRKIARIAIASDSKLAALAPRVIGHFIESDVKCFSYEEREAAMEWLRWGDYANALRAGAEDRR